MAAIQDGRESVRVEVGTSVACRERVPQPVDSRCAFGLGRAAGDIEPVLPAQMDVRCLAVDPQPHGKGAGRQLVGSVRPRVGEHADHIPPVNVGPAAFLRGEFSSEQQLCSPGCAAGQAPLLIGVQQAHRRDQ